MQGIPLNISAGLNQSINSLGNYPSIKVLSSFGYLKMFPVDKLKIDGSFIKDIADNEISRAMVSAISEIARVMNMETVAEYVQDEASIALLSELGVKWGQGFHVGVPVRLNHLFGEGTVMDMQALVEHDGILSAEPA